MKVVIIMGSDKDLEFSSRILNFIEQFKVPAQLRISSAHKTPLNVLKIIEKEKDVVYITVAGKSNALSAFVDANTIYPVISCPPLKKDKFDTDLFSSLSMPSGVAPMVVLNPENAALAALKILALQNKGLQQEIQKHQNKAKDKIDKKDKEVSNG
ncbi:MAG: AIR carboxylase family protein [Spirochaetes bacterium]|nr:AIR carboxylase family protein [Spirochaetota bacterium]